MSSYDLVVRGGIVVTAGGVAPADVGVRAGRIVAIGEDLTAGAREVDARHRLVLPGGIDTHCHIEEPADGDVHNAETFASGTAAAAAGGTTSIVCFARQVRGGSLAEAVARQQARAQASLVDYGFHLLVVDPRPEVLAELPGLIEQGHRSIKLFMTYAGAALDDGQILQLLAVARRHGAIVTVHAENDHAILFLTERLLAAGLTAPKYHCWAKPIAVEREAVHRAVMLAELVDVPIQIFHVSGAEPAAEIERAQRRGLKVFAETCPQYLVLTHEDLDRPGFEGAKFVFSPPARSAEDQQALWDYLRRGVLGVVSSDHAPYRFADPNGKMVHGTEASFDRIPNGIPGIETRLPILFSEGVSKGRIDLPTFARLAATNAAELFGLSPRKGTIAVGADADLVLWDPERKVTIANDRLHHAVDFTPYEGHVVQGWPTTTIARGEIVVEEGEVMADLGRGTLLRRDPYQAVAPTGRFGTPFSPVDGVALP